MISTKPKTLLILYMMCSAPGSRVCTENRASILAAYIRVTGPS